MRADVSATEQAPRRAAGAGAVRAAVRRLRMPAHAADPAPLRRSAAAATPVAELVRRAAGRAFVRVGDSWVETGLPGDWAAKARRVVAFSDSYFALLAAHPELQAAFALGTSVAVRMGDELLLTTAE